MKIFITRNYSGSGSRVTVIQFTVRVVKKNPNNTFHIDNRLYFEVLV